MHLSSAVMHVQSQAILDCHMQIVALAAAPSTMFVGVTTPVAHIIMTKVLGLESQLVPDFSPGGFRLLTLTASLSKCLQAIKLH